jgi:hypothetical protein
MLCAKSNLLSKRLDDCELLVGREVTQADLSACNLTEDLGNGLNI